MKSCVVRLVPLFWWGMVAKCLSELISFSVPFTQGLLLWAGYLMWSGAAVLLGVTAVHECRQKWLARRARGVTHGQ